jgi:hypothetical protein
MYKVWKNIGRILHTLGMSTNDICPRFVTISGILCEKRIGVVRPGVKYFDIDENPIYIYEIVKGRTGKEAFGKIKIGEYWYPWAGDIRGGAFSINKSDIVYMEARNDDDE